MSDIAGEGKTLRECFYEIDPDFDKEAAKLLDQIVIAKYGHWDSRTDTRDFTAWPGIHKNVLVWVRLESGHLVGWNENPSIGWSFPVIGPKSKLNPFNK